jgi:carboxyl-terminal processing protease
MGNLSKHAKRSFLRSLYAGGAVSHRLSGLLLTALLFCSVGRTSAQSGYDPQVAAGVQSFRQVYQIVKDNYAEPVSDDKAIYEGAIPGMLRVLDPHSSFFDPQDYALMLREESGERYGVGLSLTSEGSRVVVASTMPDAPARRAGIRPGDTIVAINGRSTAGLNTGAVAEMLEGARESKVSVTVNREDHPASLTFVLPRKKLKVPSVYAFLVAPRTGYLSITEFDETTASDVKQALLQLGGLDGLILDLRQNPGGLLNVATDVADMFLARGALIGTLVERSLPAEAYRVQHGNKGKYPIVVLVDGETASAAEFIAGALQDQDRALVAGQNTFGKSVAQTIFPLSDNTALALTTGRLYLPSGRLIQRPYAGLDEIEYYYSRPVNTTKRQPSYTRNGRRVYGGAGITPDIVLSVAKQNRFEDMLMRKNTIVGFSAEYVAHHRISKHSELNGDMLQQFCDYLRQKSVPYTTEDLKASSDWLRQEIKAAIITTALGPEEGLRVRAKNDPEVSSAIRLLPAATQLVSVGR